MVVWDTNTTGTSTLCRMFKGVSHASSFDFFKVRFFILTAGVFSSPCQQSCEVGSPATDLLLPTPVPLGRCFSLRWCWGGRRMASSGVCTNGHGRPGRRFMFRETNCPIHRLQKKSLPLKAKGQSGTQLRRRRQLRDYSRLSRRRSRAGDCRGREGAAGLG